MGPIILVVIVSKMCISFFSHFLRGDEKGGMHTSTKSLKSIFCPYTCSDSISCMFMSHVPFGEMLICSDILMPEVVELVCGIVVIRADVIYSELQCILSI
jgi:hypothetical protein